MDVESRAIYIFLPAFYLSSGSSYRGSIDRVIRNCHSRWNRFSDPVRSVGSVVEKSARLTFQLTWRYRSFITRPGEPLQPAMHATTYL